MRTEGSTNDGPLITFRRAWWVVAGIAVVVIAAFGIPWATTALKDDSVVLVEDFFAALEDRDVTTALDMVNPGVIPSGDEAAFLEPEAIADGWSLRSAEVKSRKRSFDIVTVDFDSEHGHGWHMSDFKVVTKPAPKLANPFIVVGFGYSPLTYAQVNESTVPLDSMSEGKVAEFYLFPGVYTFYKDVPDSVKLPKPWATAVFGDISTVDSEIVPEGLSLKPSAVSEVQAAFDERLAECVKSDEPLPTGCPFGSQDGATIVVEDSVHELRDLEWKVVQKPEIRSTVFDPPTTIDGIAIDTDPAVPWPLTLTGTGETHEGESKSVTAKCSIDPESWVVMIGEDGELELADYRPESKRPELHTCGDFS